MIPKTKNTIVLSHPLPLCSVFFGSSSTNVAVFSSSAMTAGPSLKKASEWKKFDPGGESAGYETA